MTILITTKLYVLKMTFTVYSLYLKWFYKVVTVLIGVNRVLIASYQLADLTIKVYELGAILVCFVSMQLEN